MAVADAISRPDLFPGSQAVKVFALPSVPVGELRKNNEGNPENWKPALTKLEEPSVASNGELSLGSLKSGQGYLLAAEVNSVWVYLQVVGGRGGGSVAAGSVKKVKVKTTSTEIVKANAQREGLEIRNASAGVLYLQLGAAAVAEEGIYLAVSGGSWDGMVGPSVWTGSVFGIGAAEGTVTVAEV